MKHIKLIITDLIGVLADREPICEAERKVTRAPDSAKQSLSPRKLAKQQRDESADDLESPPLGGYGVCL